MRLLAHHMLVCGVQPCVATANRLADQGPLNYPLQIQVEEREKDIVIEEREFREAFISHLLHVIDWRALRKTVEQLKLEVDLPEMLPADASQNAPLLKLLHHLLLEIEIVHGELLCGNCGRVYPISNGIPNLMLEEDEL